jgi:hypothetical protein
VTSAVFRRYCAAVDALQARIRKACAVPVVDKDEVRIVENGRTVARTWASGDVLLDLETVALDFARSRADRGLMVPFGLWGDA